VVDIHEVNRAVARAQALEIEIGGVAGAEDTDVARRLSSTFGACRAEPAAA
jgi:hypothetical protein